MVKFLPELKSDRLGGLLLTAVLWILPWLFLKYFFISKLLQDTEYVSNHACLVVYGQTMVVYYILGGYVFPQYLYRKKFLPVILILFVLLNAAHIINYLELCYLKQFSNGNSLNPSYIQKLWVRYFEPNGLLGVFKDFNIWHFTYAWSFFVVSIMLLFKLIKDILISLRRELRLERDKLQLENEKLQLEKHNLTLESKAMALQRDNLSLELNFLKSQINPHFLFNILNSIYLRTLDTNQEATTLVLKLSELMRYSLYNTNEDIVFLRDELRYITNYLDLERFRHSDQVEISYHLQGSPEDLQIPPLLLISFVENAFKHGIQDTIANCYVRIFVDVDAQGLYFTVENSLSAQDDRAFEELDKSQGGIGLQNMKKRLQLFYPGKHQIEMKESEDSYHSSLYINF
ncbi:histidine kinase [Dyadobacter sp. CY345]|uniref:sensor histidine kinase n=1 Tax=Dyadobacter sp. CY345 TaxID=2909335 RepID=UPI001F33279E|nr:histidine kinase [Dyadobacter sp. CY345]MCF2446950.1 histidine kinase [Dyadobacter sp. CY345]